MIAFFSIEQIRLTTLTSNYLYVKNCYMAIFLKYTGEAVFAPPDLFLY